ncbi:hypothetical protein SEA_VANLEE_72 [Gordonia phage VanLee]|uniref:Uncharacterized protein n=1 Tax=Gordonia phage VanLee TaxID=2845816 RepID=A0A8F2IF79_9CAUD|nr:hypothetical protein QEH49_gp072 [Gordonia phage VanLee]QWS68189.1 hypothetical protein SEA_VANLEE_72 [Gordonia phage VanLee]
MSVAYNPGTGDGHVSMPLSSLRDLVERTAQESGDKAVRFPFHIGPPEYYVIEVGP